MIRCFCVAMVLVSLAAAGNAADPAAPASARRNEARILVLTGNEYPGHKWQETAPLIARFLGIDRRLTADVNADPQFLASPKLHQYDAIVLNYLNWESPDPGEEARQNLKKFIADGKGLVIVHNACAAFGDGPSSSRSPAARGTRIAFAATIRTGRFGSRLPGAIIRSQRA